MNAQAFNALVDQQLSYCLAILNRKAEEYAANDDRLHNFKVAASLIGVPTRTALAGMMAKHTISIYDMCSTEKEYTDELWLEKITDSINYLLLLRAVIEDGKEYSQQLVLEYDDIYDIGAGLFQRSPKEWAGNSLLEDKEING